MQPVDISVFIAGEALVLQASYTAFEEVFRDAGATIKKRVKKEKAVYPS